MSQMKLLVIVLSFLFMNIDIFVVNAQSQSSGFLLREADTGLEIVTLDETGNVLSVVQSLPNYSFEPTPNPSWVLHPHFMIPTQQDIALSPDGKQLAFVAIKNENQFRLLIYRQDTRTLIEEGLPAYAYPIWSPNGENYCSKWHMYPLARHHYLKVLCISHHRVRSSIH